MVSALQDLMTRDHKGSLNATGDLRLTFILNLWFTIFEIFRRKSG